VTHLRDLIPQGGDVDLDLVNMSRKLGEAADKVAEANRKLANRVSDPTPLGFRHPFRRGDGSLGL
jgi:hypothetical protein